MVSKGPAPSAVGESFAAALEETVERGVRRETPTGEAGTHRCFS